MFDTIKSEKKWKIKKKILKKVSKNIFLVPGCQKTLDLDPDPDPEPDPDLHWGKMLDPDPDPH